MLRPALPDRWRAALIAIALVQLPPLALIGRRVTPLHDLLQTIWLLTSLAVGVALVVGLARRGTRGALLAAGAVGAAFSPSSSARIPSFSSASSVSRPPSPSPSRGQTPRPPHSPRPDSWATSSASAS